MFHGESLAEVVASWPKAAAYRVERSAENTLTERRVEARYL